MTNNEIFNSYSNQIVNVIDLETVTTAENGTGYFDGLMYLKNSFDTSDRARFTDRAGRLGIVLFTDMGNVVIFQRHTNSEEVFVTNVAPAFKNVVPNGALDKEYLEWLLNSVPTNRPTQIVNDIMKAVSIRTRADGKVLL